MKKFLLGAASLIVLAAPASAADLAARPYTKAPPPMAVALYDWSGFYLGINGGYASARKCWDFVGAATLVEGCHDSTGGTVGGQLGYRWQAGAFVFGLEGQGNWADLSGSNASLAFAGVTNRSRIDSFGLITGQVGYAWNNVLGYVKGGAAVVGDKYDSFTTAGGVLLGSATETRWGASVGAGLEVGVAPNWTVGVEYNHLFLGNRNVNFTTPAGAFFGTERIRQDVDMGLVRLNYRWGGPAVSRY